MSEKFYITTTLPYVNDKPHLGFALEIVQADILARYHALKGDEIFFNTGTDEHGQKIADAARLQGKTPKEYTDFFAEQFKKLKDPLGLSENLTFIRTSDEKHIKTAQEFWKLCEKNGDIYKAHYEGKYCIGCELEKTDSELVDGKCPLHPNLEIEIRDEENYFFRFSKYSEKLLALYEKNPDFLVPTFRLNEFKNIIAKGLKDFSISRLSSKMAWGVPVPGDPDHVMYVWFDALVNYISTLDWPEDKKKFEDFWVKGKTVQCAGKDQVRMQAGMWQAMLLSAGLAPTKQIFIHGFITSGGQKMSKSLGNVIDPFQIVEEYGSEALRYFLAREVHPFEDSDITPERLKESYNANLANGLGNLTSRIMKMAESNLTSPVEISEKTVPTEFFDFLEKFEFNKAADFIWMKIGELDKTIQESEPFKLIKTDKEKALAIIEGLVKNLYTIGRLLNPILPETSEKIKKLVKENKSPESPLFLRK